MSHKQQLNNNNINRHYKVKRLQVTVSDIQMLQRVLNAGARVVSDMKKYNCGLSTLLHDNFIGLMCQKG